MKCPICHKGTKVIDSRAAQDGIIIRRRRSCRWCKFRFSTHEELELLTLSVKKRDGQVEPYDREKLIAGVTYACGKRPVTQEDVFKLASSVEQRIQDRKKEVVPSKLIGDLVIDHLKKIDEVAYLRFASVYKSFKNAESFKKEAASLKKKR
ncbi:MAG: transcriptional repressor NrdR [Parcubacteria group bacterium]|nr:transcriptional repressor NrdR [Parcubacteria group bacterium]